MTGKNRKSQGTKVTQGKAISAIYRNKGILTKAAIDLGVTRMTLYNYMKRWPKVQAAYEDASNETLDLAELGLYKAIKDGKLAAIMFALKTKGRKRGYVERTETQEVTELEIKVTRDDE